MIIICMVVDRDEIRLRTIEQLTKLPDARPALSFTASSEGIAADNATSLVTCRRVPAAGATPTSRDRDWRSWLGADHSSSP